MIRGAFGNGYKEVQPASEVSYILWPWCTACSLGDRIQRFPKLGPHAHSKPLLKTAGTPSLRGTTVSARPLGPQIQDPVRPGGAFFGGGSSHLGPERPLLWALSCVLKEGEQRLWPCPLDPSTPPLPVKCL